MWTLQMDVKFHSFCFVISLLRLCQPVMSMRICCQAPTYDYGCTADFDGRDLPMPKCPDDIPPVFKLFTRDNPKQPQFITMDAVPSNYDLSRTKDISIVHGFTRLKLIYLWIKDALLTRGDFNVIFVDWRTGSSGTLYSRAAANSITIGLALKAVAQKLIAMGSTRHRMWCVGADLGAHVCGSAGLAFKFGRITGLDPTGPLFSHYDRGLKKESASFVDVIHTDGKGLLGTLKLGMLRPLGHADFYPGGLWGGWRQPGCPQILWHVCSHSKVVLYFIQSVTQDCFIARHKCTNPYKVNRHCSATSPTIMGYGASSSASGLYYVPVRGFPLPFCKA